MYDVLTSRYTFSCPTRGEVRVQLSAFRRLERLPGAAHPAVYRVAFECACGEQHLGLVAHDELDWAPLGVVDGTFVNLMTSRVDNLGRALGLAVRCPSCARTSVNLVSAEHVDVPFHNDPHVGVVEHVFQDDALATVEEFRQELYSASFDLRRLNLE